MKKVKLLIALCLAGCLAKAQIVSNGDFETYGTLPSSTCPTSTSASTVSDATGWNVAYSTFSTLANSNICTAGGSYNSTYPQAIYYNNSIGSNGSCVTVSPHSGNGFVVCQNEGAYVLANTTGWYTAVAQPIGTTLYSGCNYLFTCYEYIGGSYSGGVAAVLGSSIGTLTSSAPTTTITGTSGWVKVQSTLTVPSNGTYTLYVGTPGAYCFLASSVKIYYAIDDVSLVEQPCPADAGPNKINQQDNCGNWPGVQIGTAAVTNMTYGWIPTCHLNAGHLSSCSVAQPTSAWTNTTTPEVYTVSVSGLGCTTATSTVQVTAVGCGANCGVGCRTTAGIATANQTASTFAVYPNPSNAEITISLYDQADYIRITDLQGRTVYETKDTDGGELKLDISQYTKGIYFVLVKIGDRLEKQKLVVE